VRTGDGDALAVTHQLGEQFGSVYHRNAPSDGGGDFRVVGRDGGGDDYRAGIAQMIRGMAEVNRGAQPAEALKVGTVGEIGPGNSESLTQEEAGEGAHADAARSDEVKASAAAEIVKPLAVRDAHVLNEPADGLREATGKTL